MDAVKFPSELARMCKVECNNCLNCPMCSNNNGTELICMKFAKAYPERAVEIVTKWSDEHPEKTLKDVLLDKFPEANVSFICPEYIWTKFNGECNTCYTKCVACWSRPASLLDEKPEG